MAGRALVAALLLAVVGGGCGGSAPAPRGWAGIDQRIDQRVQDDDLDGAVLVVRRGTTTLHQHTSGSYRLDTEVPIASASKWLTAALVMTLVDQGKLTLDAPVAAYAPELAGLVGPAVTMRQLLSHTHGLGPTDGCELDPVASDGSTACNGTPVDPPGTTFAYGSTGPDLAGRVVEVLTGQPFETAFQQRIAEPVGMTGTTFLGSPGKGETAQPDPAGSARSTASDYLRFEQMLAAGGTIDGRTVLSPASVQSMFQVETAHAHFKDDEVAAELDSIGYALGAWVESANADGRAEVIDGSGAYGAYPWIDTRRGVYGIVLVVDGNDPGPSGAVSRSHDDMMAVDRVLDGRS